MPFGFGTLLVASTLMIQWATDVIDAIGLVGVALLVALESAFPPIPSELVLLLTGFNVSEARFNLVTAIVAATVGSVLGAWILYAAGALLHEDRMERFLAGFGRFLGLKREDIHRANLWFERHGPAVIFFGRLVPIVRSLVSVPAGADRMNFAMFTLFTALGSAVWNSIWITIGWRLGDRWKQAERWSEVVELVLLAALAVGLVVLVGRRVRANRIAARAAATGQQDAPAAAPPPGQPAPPSHRPEHAPRPTEASRPAMELGPDHGP